MTTSETMESTGTSYCVDADKDSFGDPSMCTNVPGGDTPPDGTVPNDPDDPSDDDCDDANKNTHPGAAENDSDTLCQQDNDKDGFGDDSPPPGVEPGTDCDDDNINTHPGIDPNNPDACQQDNDMDGQGDSDPPQGVEPGLDCDDSDPNTFVGAAEIENPAACMKDEDEDGWGDTSVPQGVESGSDCYDSNPELNPDDRVLISLMDNGEVHEVDPNTGTMDVYTTFDNLGVNGDSLVSVAIDPESGMMYASQISGPDRLWFFDYCSSDTPIELMPHGLSLCGLAFTPDGVLYGIDSSSSLSDNIVVLDTATGTVEAMTPISLDGLPINVGGCGMAYDCVHDQMLVSHGSQSQILRIDPVTGIAEVVADVAEGNWGAVGLEYDPVSRRVLSNNGNELFEIEIDGSDSYSGPVTLFYSIDDLHFGPTCG